MHCLSTKDGGPIVLQNQKQLVLTFSSLILELGLEIPDQSIAANTSLNSGILNTKHIPALITTNPISECSKDLSPPLKNCKLIDGQSFPKGDPDQTSSLTNHMNYNRNWVHTCTAA